MKTNDLERFSCSELRLNETIKISGGGKVAYVVGYILGMMVESANTYVSLAYDYGQ